MSREAPDGQCSDHREGKDLRDPLGGVFLDLRGPGTLFSINTIFASVICFFKLEPSAEVGTGKGTWKFSYLSFKMAMFLNKV